MAEDIEFLKQNSMEDAVVLFFDSSLRNRTIDPSPSSYSVTFDDPIKRVHGFQVLDASLPNTMYVVDTYNDTLTVSLVAATASSGPGYLAEISRSKTFAGVYNSASQPSNVCCVSSFSGEATGDVGQFWAFVRSVLPAVPLTEVTPHTSYVENYVFTYDHRQLYVPATRTDVVSVLSGGDFALVASTTVPGTYDVVGFTAFNVSEETYTALVVSAVQLFTVETRAIQIPVGNYDLRSLRMALASALVPLGISVNHASNPDTLQSKYTLSCQNLFVINEAAGGLADNLGYDFAPVAASTQSSYPFAFVCVGDNPNNFRAVYDPAANVYTMTSPGIVNLLGQRSVLLRCPELEMHMGSFTSSRYAVGLGLFKMGVNPNGVANTRFDFVSFSVAPFHPIEKLSKLTFSFETIDQQPYDFKGVNHQLTVAIKYWRLVQRVRFFDDDAPAPVFRSVLAPGYHPDYVNRGIPTNISANEDYYEQQDDRSPEAIKIYNASLAAYYDRTRDCPQPGSLP